MAVRRSDPGQVRLARPEYTGKLRVKEG